MSQENVIILIAEVSKFKRLKGKGLMFSLKSLQKVHKMRFPKNRQIFTLKCPLMMKDETCARIMEATEHGMGQQSIYLSCLWSGPPNTTRTH
jgi:hypothetical protein